MKLRRSRPAARGRIEIIPMIDVMFFLLVTFMLASLSLQNLHSLGVSLPKGEAAPLSTVKAPITLTITASGQILVNQTPVKLEGVAGAVKPLVVGAEPSVIVNADAAAPHGIVTEAMLRARDAGIEHFLIAVKHDH